MNRITAGKKLAVVMAAFLTACPLSPAGASADEARGPAGTAAPINAKLAPPNVAPAAAFAVSSSGEEISWSAPIRQTSTGSVFHWSLPMAGPLSTVGGALATARRVIHRGPRVAPKRLETGIALGDDSNVVGQRIDELLDAALDRSDRAKSLDAAVAHYRTATQKVIAETKDGLDYLVPFRGFGPSSEAGDIILDEKLKVKSRASAEYARQRHIDETHVKVVTNLMQVAMGMGMADRERGLAISGKGMESLRALVGEEEALRTYRMLETWSSELRLPDSVYQRPVWDVADRQNKLKYVMETSLENDQVVHEIKKRLHKYNQRSKFMMVSSHVVQTTLGVASLTPSFVGPAAKLALLTWVMATGGPESCKLLKELYLDKRFESRWKVINEEAHMALENYQLAILTRNPVLLACSESLIGQISGPENITEVLGQSVLPKNESGPEEAGTAPAGPSLVSGGHVVSQ